MFQVIARLGLNGRVTATCDRGKLHGGVDPWHPAVPGGSEVPLAIPHVDAVGDGDDVLSRDARRFKRTETENARCNSELERFHVQHGENPLREGIGSTVTPPRVTTVDNGDTFAQKPKFRYTAKGLLRRA